MERGLIERDGTRKPGYDGVQARLTLRLGASPQQRAGQAAEQQHADRRAADRQRHADAAAGAPGFDVAACDDLRIVVASALARLAARAAASPPRRVASRRRGALGAASASPPLTIPAPKSRRRARALHDLRARLLARIGLAPLALERDAGTPSRSASRDR